MNTYSIEKIAGIIEYIEENIKGKITLEDIASYSNFSKFHLTRIFKAIVNLGVMEYVRGRALSHSINDLLNSDFNIIDIAYNYNFSHESSYTRAFKSTFGISPKKFCKNKVPIKIIEKFDTHCITPIGKNAFMLEPTIMVKPSFNIVGIKNKIFFEDNVKFHTVNKVGFDFWYNHKNKIINALSPNIYIGLAQYINGVSDYKYYTACLQTLNLRKIPDGMIGLNISTQKYAVFKYIFFHSIRTFSIEDVKENQFHFNQWLNDSNYQMSDHFLFESIDYNAVMEDYFEVEYYIPVKIKFECPKNGSLLIPMQL